MSLLAVPAPPPALLRLFSGCSFCPASRLWGGAPPLTFRFAAGARARAPAPFSFPLSLQFFNLFLGWCASLRSRPLDAPVRSRRARPRARPLPLPCFPASLLQSGAHCCAAAPLTFRGAAGARDRAPAPIM